MLNTWKISRSCRSLNAQVTLGFTLLELLIVVSIISILMGVSYPSISTMYEATKRNAAAVEFIGLCRYAKTQAIVKQHDVNIFIDLEKHEYWFDPRKDLDPPEDTKNNIIRGNTRSSRNIVGRMEEVHTLAKGISLGAITAYDRQFIDKTLVALDFFQDGSASPVTVEFKSQLKGKEQIVSVELLRPSGNARIIKHEKDAPDMAGGTLK